MMDVNETLRTQESLLYWWEALVCKTTKCSEGSHTVCDAQTTQLLPQPYTPNQIPP